MEKIFEEYECKLQYFLDNKIKLRQLPFLFEERGTNYDDFKKIVDDIIISLEYAVETTIDSNKALISKNIITDNSFLYKPTLIIVWNSNSTTEASVMLSDCYYDNNNDKLKNVTIVYYESDETYPKHNNIELKQSLWHELQHIYRHYQVLKKEFEKGQLNPKEKRYQELYSVDGIEGKAFDTVKATFYYTDVNEINSHFNEMIPYIEGHKEINFKNYKNYLKDTPGYDVILKLKELATLFNDDEMFYNEKFIKIIGGVIHDNFYKGVTPKNCVKRLRNRVNSALLYAQKQFYKILSYTLSKCLREEKFVTKNIFECNFQKDYKEILTN